MAKALTQRQGAFCLAYVETCNASEAYRRAYSTNASPKTINEKASRLLKEGKIGARIADLRAPAVEAARITHASHLQRLHALGGKAEAKGQFSAAIGAEVARGKVAGLYDEKPPPEVPELTPEERMKRLLEVVIVGARRARERDGSQLLTELLRAAFEEERRPFLKLIKEFLDSERKARVPPLPLQVEHGRDEVAAMRPEGSQMVSSRLPITTTASGVLTGPSASAEAGANGTPMRRLPSRAEEPEWVRRARR